MHIPNPNNTDNVKSHPYTVRAYILRTDLWKQTPVFSAGVPLLPHTRPASTINRAARYVNRYTEPGHTVDQIKTLIRSAFARIIIPRQNGLLRKDKERTFNRSHSVQTTGQILDSGYLAQVKQLWDCGPQALFQDFLRTLRPKCSYFIKQVIQF